MITLLWGCSAYILLFQQNLLAKLNQIVVTNLLNVYNFWQIKNGQSYFERFAANESPFVHLWTMSIEGQFYIIWPLIIFLLVKFAKNKKTIFWIISSFLANLEVKCKSRKKKSLALKYCGSYIISSYLTNGNESNFQSTKSICLSWRDALIFTSNNDFCWNHCSSRQ